MNDRPRYRLVRTVGPVSAPITLSDARTQIRSDETVDQGGLQIMVDAAIDAAEAYTNRKFITQTWKAYLDQWPGGSIAPFVPGNFTGVPFGMAPTFIELPFGNLQSVSSINTYSDADVPSLWASTNYGVDVAGLLGRVVVKAGAVWPTFTRTFNGIEIIFVCGYGDKAKDVPASLRMALLRIVAHLYEHRGDDIDPANPPNWFTTLLDPWRISNQ